MCLFVKAAPVAEGGGRSLLLADGLGRLHRAHRVRGIAGRLGEPQRVLRLVGLRCLRNHRLHFLVTHRVLAPI